MSRDQLFLPRAKRKRGDPKRDSDRVYIMGLRLSREEDDWITDFAAAEPGLTKQDVIYRALRNLYNNERQKDRELLSKSPVPASGVPRCPRCGVGWDTDGDGNCARCAKLSDEQAANLRRMNAP